MVELSKLVGYCDEKLNIGAYQDYCPNGLQVEGRAEVGKIVSGVTASQALIDRAIEVGADLLLVHHGYFWKGEAAPIVGMKQRRIKALLANGISLLAYHLPLDGHPELGNNALMGEALGFRATGRFLDNNLGMLGELDSAMPIARLAERIETCLAYKPLVIEPWVERPVQRVAWCSGAAQGYLEQAAAQGADLYISGEISEPTVHMARELGLYYIAAGHHATERFGVRALGEHLARHFDLAHEFIDLPVPV